MNEYDEYEKKNYNKLLEVAEELIKAKWKVKSIDFDNHLITVSRFFAQVEIYCDVYEQRVTLKEKYHPNCYRYLEVKEDKMVNAIIKLINEFRHENYRLTYINRYGQSMGHDQLDDYYFSNEQSLLEFLCDEKVADETLYSLEEREHQYPNPACKLMVKRVKNANDITNKYWPFKESLIFECHSIQYEVEECGYNQKVLDEIKEDKTYYACVSIRD